MVGVPTKEIDTSIIKATMIAFKIVPIPGFWSKKILRKITNKLTKKVITPIDDTPAFKAGIKSGDYIVKIDGKQVQGKHLWKQ